MAHECGASPELPWQYCPWCGAALAAPADQRNAVLRHVKRQVAAEGLEYSSALENRLSRHRRALLAELHALGIYPPMVNRIYRHFFTLADVAACDDCALQDVFSLSPTWIRRFRAAWSVAHPDA